MSHREIIVYMQIGAITVAIFLALLVGAAALTKALNRREAQTDQKNAKQEQYSNPKVIQKNNTEFEEKISAGKLLMPRQIKKGLKYFKEVSSMSINRLFPNNKIFFVNLFVSYIFSCLFCSLIK